MERVFVINAPFYFNIVWTLIKSMLDKKTVGKITILSSNGIKEMSEYFDVKVLPKSMGG